MVTEERLQRIGCKKYYGSSRDLEDVRRMKCPPAK
jgi:hypothetical protein